MRRIFKRLEALEGAADRKLLSDNFAMDVAVAYYLGGARHESELTQASATALGYKNVTEFCKAARISRVIYANCSRIGETI